MRVERAAPAARSLPAAAFAIVGDAADPGTWRFPHHRRSILRSLEGKVNVEKTVDWQTMPSVVAALSPRRRRTGADISPEDVLRAAGHLAEHYLKSGRPLPDVLAALT